MSGMMSIISNLLAPVSGNDVYTLYRIITLVLLLVMMVAAIVAILIVLFQPGNSTGIDALGGSSETFFGKNKGRSIEYKMKKWTVIVLVVLTILSILFFILQMDAVWGVTA
ncbi:MAG TPA: preprotein translocase subunit SecG [Candidatus Borkfalkia excrementipullorum]|nr:preprotein translocase subunit SecG [Candidatus Borkfalkia excrementipullorum]